MPRDHAVELVDVTKTFGPVVAGDQINLAIQDGEFFSLLGPSGCGKTTTLRMIAGFEMPSAGELYIEGEMQGYLPAYKRPVNTDFQHYALFPHMTVWEDVAFGLKLRRAMQIELKSLQENENITFSMPEEGGVVWVDPMCIPATVTPGVKLGAEMFIDFMLRADNGAMLSEYNWYASPNGAAEELFNEEFLNDTTVCPPADGLEKLQYIKPLGEFESVYLRLWDEVKSAA